MNSERLSISCRSFIGRAINAGITLRTQLGEFVITFETRYPKGGVDRSSLSASDLPEVTDVRSTDIAERDPRSSDSGDTSGTADLVFASAPNGPASGAPSPNSAARSTQRSAGTCIKISRAHLICPLLSGPKSLLF